MTRKKVILIFSLIIIIATLTVGTIGVLNFNKCKASGGVWNYEKKICEHSISTSLK
jgi:uncharacterized membrane protein YuzA (DUF378 family)